MEKRLYKSRNERMVFGVCGGIAEYFNVDPTIVRLALVLLVFSGFGIVAYIVAAIVMPEEPVVTSRTQPSEKEVVVEEEDVKEKDE